MSGSQSSSYSSPKNTPSGVKMIHGKDEVPIQEFDYPYAFVLQTNVGKSDSESEPCYHKVKDTWKHGKQPARSSWRKLDQRNDWTTRWDPTDWI